MGKQRRVRGGRWGRGAIALSTTAAIAAMPACQSALPDVPDPLALLEPGPAGPAEADEAAPALAASTRAAATREELMLIQSQVMDFADDFSLRMADLTDRVEAQRPSMETRIAAHRLRYTMAHGLTIIAASSNPRVNLIDAVVVMTLQARLLEERLGPEHFVQSPWVVGVFQDGAAQIRKTAERTLSPEQLGEVDALVEAWLAENPGRNYAAYIRLDDFAERRGEDSQAEESGERGASSILGLLFIDPLAGLDPTTREIQQTRLFAERAMFYVQRMPQLLSWQAELLYIDGVSEPEIEQALSDVTTLTAAVDRTTRDITQLREDLPVIIASEREQAIDQAMARFFEGLAVERNAMLDDLEQRTTALNATLTEFDSAFRAGESFGREGAELVRSIESLTKTIQAMQGEPDPNANPEDEPTIEDYERLVVTATTLVEKLDGLVADVDALASSDVWETRRVTIDQTVGDAQSRVETVVDRAYRRGLTLVVVLLAGGLVIGLTLKLVPSRTRA